MESLLAPEQASPPTALETPVAESYGEYRQVTDESVVATAALLLDRLGGDARLPTPPAVALQVLERASRPDCTLAQISDIVRNDPGLCGRILKTVNSALFGMPRSISSIDRALSLLGLKAVRSLVLSFSLPAMQSNWSHDARSFWKSSVAGSVLARELAIRMGNKDSEDDFIAGLLRDVGATLLENLYPEQYALFHELPVEDWVLKQIERERAAFGVDHAALGAELFRRWRLPVEITEPIRHHHLSEGTIGLDSLISSRAEILEFANLIAQLLATPQLPALNARVVELAQLRFRFKEQEFCEFLQAQTVKIQEFATLLNVDIGSKAETMQAVASATEELVKLTMETAMENVRVREENRQSQLEALRWRRTAYRLKKQATRDALTGAFNRGYFEEALVTEFKRAARRCSILGLIFLDLDGFKKLNDGFGHEFGDKVLKDVVACMKRESRESDILARYGGDEFCVIVSDTNNDKIRETADRYWNAINSHVVRLGENEGRVGASIGAVVCLPHRATLTYEEFLASADKAMYSVKHNGKNRVTVLSLLTSEDLALVAEVERRLFRVYLLETADLTVHQIDEASRWVGSPAYFVGRLARQRGWISARNLRKVLAEQKATKKLFGEIAVRQGYLKPWQLFSLLAMQRERPEDLAENLVELCLLAEGEAERAVSGYYKWLTTLTK